MLKPVALANALAIVTAIFYLVMWILGVVAPRLFVFVLNAQFLGANVASLYPRKPDATTFIITLVVISATAWLFGYLWAYIYNRLAK